MDTGSGGLALGGRAIIIRDASDDDMNAVEAIYAPHVLKGRASFEEEPPSISELSARRRAVLALGLPYLAAEADGKVLGYAYAGTYRSRSAYRYTIEDSVYVAEDCAGRGVGRALLAELLARCDRGPWRQMVAVIGDSGNLASINLHRSLGFRTVGTLKAVGYKFGEWIDSVYMQRPLGAGDSARPE